jgi:diacylglycerol kinase family enzyme
MAYGAALPLNLVPRMAGVRMIRAEEVEIETRRVPAQADGDPAGEAPLTVTNAKTPINVVVG